MVLPQCSANFEQQSQREKKRVGGGTGGKSGRGYCTVGLVFPGLRARIAPALLGRSGI